MWLSSMGGRASQDFHLPLYSHVIDNLERACFLIKDGKGGWGVWAIISNKGWKNIVKLWSHPLGSRLVVNLWILTAEYFPIFSNQSITNLLKIMPHQLIYIGRPMAIIYNSTKSASSERIKWEATSDTTFTYNAWSHWVITWAPSDGVKLYINGALSADQANSESTSSFKPGPLSFGKFFITYYDSLLAISTLSEF